MKFLKNLDFKNKRVLMRADYNVPVEHGKIKDDWRIQLTLPTIEYILNQPKSKLVLLSHMGRPEGKPDPEFSLQPVARRLEELLGREVSFIADLRSEAAEKTIRNLAEGGIAMAENLRFYPEEEDNSEDFAVNLCHHFGVFVNDAFSVSHRAHASLAQIPKFKPACAGLLFQKEMEELSKALNPARRPALAVIGGAKIETKLPVIENLAKLYDAVLLGGKIAVEAREKDIKFSPNVVIAEDFSEGNLDIGPRTIAKYKTAISAASFITWNGPMGKFEEEKSSWGTNEIYGAILAADAYKIAGGGETVEFVHMKGGGNEFDFISSGGGAMLDYLSGIVLPGIEALENNR